MLICPSCSHPTAETFYSCPGVPTNSVLLLNSEAEARALPRGDIQLAFCRSCGHIFNSAFDPQLTEYSGRYESTQGFSPTFNRFNRQLAQQLIDRFNLHGKSIIEIGCGNGEFLTLLCELGGNRGLGFDPAYQPGRVTAATGIEIDYIADFYSEVYTDRDADFFVCKMTLEHILPTADFVRTVRRAIGERPEAVVFFQIPNARYVLAEQAFWDVYYEHCSYFTHGSLASLFRQARFDVLDLWTAYDDQYLMIAARPTAQPTTSSLPAEDDLAAVAAEVAHFQQDIPQQLDRWRTLIQSRHAAGETIVLWGGGSKGVAFMTTLGITREIQFAVDVNPHKAHTFFAGSGQEIIQPADLIPLQPDLVIIMNPVYTAEITADLHRMGLQPEIIGLGKI